MKKRRKEERKKEKKQARKVSRWLYWTPRVLAILFILFISIFALDVFDENLGFWGTILGLFMHLIPTWILIITLIFAWRREWIGGVVFILGGLLYVTIVLINIIKSGGLYMIVWNVQIAGPAFLIGILFFINWFKKTRIQR